jgi:hypothetical protein
VATPPAPSTTPSTDSGGACRQGSFQTSARRTAPSITDTLNETHDGLVQHGVQIFGELGLLFAAAQQQEQEQWEVRQFP